MNEPFVDLLMRLERARRENATAWVLVTIDEESGEVVCASGPFAEPEQALLASAREDEDLRRLEESGWRHVVVPLWEPAA